MADTTFVVGTTVTVQGISIIVTGLAVLVCVISGAVAQVGSLISSVVAGRVWRLWSLTAVRGLRNYSTVSVGVGSLGKGLVFGQEYGSRLLDSLGS